MLLDRRVLTNFPYSDLTTKSLQSAIFHAIRFNWILERFFPAKKMLKVLMVVEWILLLARIYTDPILFEKLFETFGGEFFIGSFNEAPAFENFKLQGGHLYAFSAGYKLKPKLEAEIQFSKYKIKATTDFPIVAIDETTFEERNTTGHLKTTLKNTAIRVAVNYAPYSGIVQPYGGFGMTYTTTKSTQTDVQMETVVFNLSEHSAKQSFGFLIQIGARIFIQPNFFVKINGQVFSVKTNSEAIRLDKNLSIGAGIRF